MNRRQLLARLIAGVAVPATLSAARSIPRVPGSRVRIALNAYSFNRPLMSHEMSLEDVVKYCAEQGIDGLDATGYYFPGYPSVPSDEYVFNLRRSAFLNGVTISGSGVRNDFTLVDNASRQKQIQLVKDWIVVTRKLGADVLRVFSGPNVPKGYSFDQVLERMIPAFRECAKFGEENGVIVGLQHHNDFLKTADETISVVEQVNSPHFSVILDIGSLRQGDPYAEIEKLLPYACTWQIKEQVYHADKAADVDLAKIRSLIEKVGYRGFLPIEALGPGSPQQVVTAFLTKVKKAFGQA